MSVLSVMSGSVTETLFHSICLVEDELVQLAGGGNPTGSAHPVDVHHVTLPLLHEVCCWLKGTSSCLGIPNRKAPISLISATFKLAASPTCTIGVWVRGDDICPQSPGGQTRPARLHPASLPVRLRVGEALAPTSLPADKRLQVFNDF